MDELVANLQHLSENAELDSEWLSDFVKQWRQLNDAERKAMIQLEEVRSKLISKETELSLLQADINMLAVDRDNKVAEIEGITAQLSLIKEENLILHQRILSLESSLEDLRLKNIQLSDEILKKTEQLRSLEETKSRRNNEVAHEEVNLQIKDLQQKIEELQSERNQLLKQRESLEKDKDTQIKALQDALDDALESKIKIQTKYEKELRELQDSNSNLVDDFEWKLRQIESTCRKKLQDKDRQIEERVQEARQSSSVDLTAERQQLDEERRAVKEQLRQVAHLKAHEAEVTQLRGVTDEQQKSLRAASRQLEGLKLNERLMQDELRNLKTLLEKEKSHMQVVQNSAQRRYDLFEESTKHKIERQKNDLNAKWEDKLKDEVERIKRDLIRLHSEEKRLAVESLKADKEKEFTSAKEKWERSRQDLAKEVSKLKDEIAAKEISYQKEISKATTIIDRENWELRRKMEKMSNEYMEELDRLKESHSEEMELLTTRYDNALVQIDKLRQRVEEYEKTTRSSDSVETTEKDSGFAAGGSSQSIVDHTNNDQDELEEECSSEEEASEEESEEAEESDEDEKGEKDEDTKVTADEDKSHLSIDCLREEVANLQDSIETLTLSLVQNEVEGKEDEATKDTPALIVSSSATEEPSSSSEVDNSTSVSMKSAESSAVSSDADESE